MKRFYITGIILVIVLAIAVPITTANTIVFDPVSMEINPGQNADIAIKLDITSINRNDGPSYYGGMIYHLGPLPRTISKQATDIGPLI